MRLYNYKTEVAYGCHTSDCISPTLSALNVSIVIIEGPCYITSNTTPRFATQWPPLYDIYCYPPC